MPLVSINILTKNRAASLEKALRSVMRQSFSDYEIVVVNDGSNDNTQQLLNALISEGYPIRVINHQKSEGITASRQEALQESRGEYLAILDDDDEWIDIDKLQKQVGYLHEHPDCALVGGGIKSELRVKNQELRYRQETGGQIRRTMLFRNNFFTSTVMFRREQALNAGGFIKDADDLAEDYDLWLRLLQKEAGYNFPQIFAKYRQPDYNKEKFVQFLVKQLRLIRRHRKDYPCFVMAWIILKIRILIKH